MSTFTLVAPNGRKIIGTYEMMPNMHHVEFDVEDGKMTYDWVGGHEDWYEGNETQTLEGEVIVVDETRALWLMRECRPSVENPEDWPALAAAEGWSLKAHGSDGRISLARVEAAWKFSNDTDALVHVVSRALVDYLDGPHQRALEHWLDEDPVSYTDAMERVTHRLPDVAKV